MKLQKHFVWLVLVTIFVVLIIFALLPKPLMVDLATVSSGPLMVTVDAEGKTRIRERYIVSSPLAGRLRRLELHAGDPLIMGQTLLAVIEPSDPALLDPRAHAQAKARVNAASAAKDQAQPHLERMKAVHELAEKELGRVRALIPSNVISQQDIDMAVMNERTAREDLKVAQFALHIAGFELEQAQAALISTRPRAVDEPDTERFEIRSPIAGRVLRVLQESSTIVSPGTPLLELGDPHDLEVEVDTLSSDAVQIKPGTKVLLEHWGGKNPLTGSVRLVEPAGFTKVSALGVEEQRVWVIVAINNPPEQRQSLGDAYRIEARFVIWEADQVIKVPAGALFRLDKEWGVYVIENGHARLRTIKIGHNNGLEAEVLAGLAIDEQVIVHPGDKIRDGVSVTPRSNKRDTH